MKPDWATRLQRTFARRYDAGFAKGLMFGKAVGARDERDRIVALLEDYIPFFYELSPNSDAGKYPIEGIIELIKGETNE